MTDAYNGAGSGSEDEVDAPSNSVSQLDSYTAPKHLLNEFADEESEDPFEPPSKKRHIAARQNEYQLRRFERDLGETQKDAFNAQAGDDSSEAASYKDAMRLQQLEKEEQRVARAIEAKQQEEAAAGSKDGVKKEEGGDATPKKRRWDVGESSPERSNQQIPDQKWDEAEDQKQQPQAAAAPPQKKRRSRWDETPAEATPAPSTPPTASTTKKPSRRSRWDQTPAEGSGAAAGTQDDKTAAITDGKDAAMVDGTSGAVTATTASGALTLDKRNRALSDEELDEILPSEGYEIVEPPPGYAPIRAPARKLTGEPTPSHGFTMQDEESARQMAAMVAPELPTEIEGVGQLAFFKAEDQQHFSKILGQQKDETTLTVDELKERKILRLLLKIKNGTPPMRKTALRHITENARQFGAGPLFDKILPLLMERSLEDQERHLLVKVIDRILYKLDDLVRPYVHKILVVIEPLLIDEDYYARVEGREIISNLSKAAGLAHMISTMRPDIDHVDEYVRNTTARAFSVVASALGIPSLMPFLKAVCRSKKSWQARHTGIKIIQQIAIMMGCAVLPHLKSAVDAVAHGLEDENQKVRTMTALAIAALAEAATPYGIESFDGVLRPLWTGIRKHRGKALAAFLKAIGFIIPLMNPEYANNYTREVMVTLIREFQSPDEEMKKIVLKVVKQCSGTEGVEPQFIKTEILPEFFKSFWVRRMAMDKRNYRQVVETTVELAKKAGVSEIVNRITTALKDENEQYRKMAMETIQKVVHNQGASDIDERLETQLVDGIIYAFHEQTVEDYVMLDGFGTIVNALGIRIRPYLPQIVSSILFRLGNKSAKVRQQAADLISKLAVVIKQCGEDQLLSKLGVVLFEQLGEEYPDALGSIIAAEASIANVVGMTQMNPPVKDLLPRMTPILRNRHEKVQEASINLIGRIADRGAEFVSAREWMRICFELVDLLKAHKKAIRRAAVNSFGYIAKAIGPQDVLSVLLTNLRVQERQSRVCSCVAIAIVAESCGPFTCIPAILNEYRTPELNVRNGCLKAMSFIFEYIGEMGKDYIHSVLTCLEDALTDRDPVHRQTASAIVRHLALGTAGLGNEDALLHLLNLVWPNILEQSPHLINNVSEAIEAMRVGLGPGIILNYCLQGLFHPARRLREIYWRTYNTLYLGAEDALVPYYPNLGELSDDRNQYDRDVLYMWV